MNPNQDSTYADIQAEYEIRHENLMNSMRHAYDVLQHEFSIARDELAEQQRPRRESVNASRVSQPAIRRNASFGHGINSREMSAIERDLHAMNEMTPEGFEPVAAKIEDTFASNAFTESAPVDMVHNRRK